MSDRWRDRARCAEANARPGDWDLFPEDLAHPGSREYLRRVDQLRKEFCWSCPVRTECLRDGLDEEYGIRGGLTQQERRHLTQLVCHCGRDIDPKDMLDRNRRHFCGKCRPIVFERAVRFGS